MYSGECDFPFRIKVIGISDIEQIFRHYENECYYNGKGIPNFISHYPGKTNVEKNMSRMGDKFNKIGKDKKGKRQKVTPTPSDESFSSDIE